MQLAWQFRRRAAGSARSMPASSPALRLLVTPVVGLGATVVLTVDVVVVARVPVVLETVVEVVVLVVVVGSTTQKQLSGS